MSDSSGTINFFQACIILMLMNGLANHVIVNPMLLDASGRDAWLAVLAAGVPFLAWSGLLFWFMKRSGQRRLLPWLSARTHPIAGWLFVAPLCAQMYMIGGMTTIHTTTWTLANYLPMTPKLLIVLSMAIVCAMPAIWGLRSIAVMSACLLPIVIALGYFVGFSNMRHKDFTLLVPIAEHGFGPIWGGMVYAGGGFVELVALLAMQHKIQAKLKLWKILLFAAISVYVMFGPVLGAITEFGPTEAMLQMESPYEQWRLVKLGEYVEHIDFFSIFQWMAGACVRVSLSVYLLVELLGARGRKRLGIALGAIASYVVAGMLPINEYDFYVWMYEYYFPISLSVMLAASACWLAVALIGGKERPVGAA
ncbi:GerAB/ArcD/ProY family transporter [Cohnella sp. GCM10027633]|uniref:GerAB/ArcD/ProY family transporter n=1 Tax=unclassified Cohnella TaxID=2636738 RepID=UPI0036382C6B